MDCQIIYKYNRFNRELDTESKYLSTECYWNIYKFFSVEKQDQKKLQYCSGAQKRALIESVTADTELISGKFSNRFTLKDAQNKWEKIAATLNSIPGGAERLETVEKGMLLSYRADPQMCASYRAF